MKKLLSFVLVSALLVTVLAGCQLALPVTRSAPEFSDPVPEQTAPATLDAPAPAPVETVPAATQSVVSMITAQDAIAIALQDAGLKKEDVRDLDAELDHDNGDVHYDVDFEKDNKDYDYEIHAETGKILKKEVPAKATPASTTTTEKPKQITRDEAKNIALKHAGLTAAQVRDLEVELDRDDGTKHYDVSFDADGYDYDYEIHAETGKILKSEKERD